MLYQRQSLNAAWGGKLTRTSIIPISIHCTGLQYRINDASITSIATHCTGLRSLRLKDYDLISDASIITIL